MVVWRIGADERVGIGDCVGAVAAVRSSVQTVCARIFEVDLVADAGAGRHDAEVVEGLLAPLQEVVALAVALDIRARRCGRTPVACRTRRRSPSGR